MKTSELQGAALDWAVAKCEGNIGHELKDFWLVHMEDPDLQYSTNWAQGGPILERERMMIEPYNDQWRAHKFTDEPPFVRAFGPTPLIAAMRCYVASILGDEVEILGGLK